MLPPFSLPSNPAVKVTLREANVADCIDFAGVTDGHEEEVTTLFLNRVQDKACYSDSATWTGDDRRFALLWYWLHTSRDHEVGHSYDCRCGETHGFVLNYNLLFNEYKAIQGKPERDIEFDGKRITVRPLTGADLEALECMRLALEGKQSTGAYKKQLAAIRLARVERCLEFHGEESSAPAKVAEKAKKLFAGYRKGDKPEKAERAPSRLGEMPFSKFQELKALVDAALAEMEHGLNTVEIDGEVMLITPPHQCPNDKEVSTRLRVTFRNSDQVPRLL